MCFICIHVFQLLPVLTGIGPNCWAFSAKLSKFAIVVRLYSPTFLVMSLINNSQIILAVIVLHLSVTGDIRGNLYFAVERQSRE